MAGDVTIGEEASIWPGCSLRGDIAPIVIGAHSNIQDGSVVHVADDLPAIVGEWVTVGHKAIVHACEIEDEVLIGMGSIILDGAKIGRRCIIGANATVTMGMEVPPGSLVLGSPATVKKALSEERAVRHSPVGRALRNPFPRLPGPDAQAAGQLPRASLADTFSA